MDGASPAQTKSEPNPLQKHAPWKAGLIPLMKPACFEMCPIPATLTDRYTDCFYSVGFVGNRSSLVTPHKSEGS